VYYGIRDYENALKYYSASLNEMGKHHVTYHNMGLCFYSKRMLTDAADCFQNACALCSTYQKAATWLQRVKSELAAPAQDALQESPSNQVGVQQIELELPKRELPCENSPTSQENSSMNN